VTGSLSIASGLQTARQSSPDCVLESFRLARESNYLLLQTMKADKRLNKIPHVLIAASMPEGDDLEQAMAFGPARILIRPITPQQLAAEISELLSAVHGI
jgi:CheY-like chemotaxis protein